MSRNGLWINEHTFVNFSDLPAGRQGAEQSLTREIATRSRAIDFYSLGMYLPNPDPVLKKMGKDITIYTELLSDAHLGGCVTSRKAGVRSLEWEIDRGKAKSRQAKDIQKVFADLDIDRIIGEILNAPLFGYQPLEIAWSRAEGTEGHIYPEDVVGKPQRWFVFNEQNELRFLTKENTSGEQLPERKFLLARHEPTYANPYGFASLSRCFWPVTFKKGGFKFWVMFAEKYGMPFLVGKHPRGAGKSETDALADMLTQMIQDAIAVIPDDSSVEIMTVEGRASGDIYNKLIEACKGEMSIAMLGQNLTTQVQGGSYAATESHMEVRKDITDGDKKIVQQTFNTLIRWVYEWNYSERVSAYPKFIMYEEEDVDKALAERDEILTHAGVRFTKKYFQKGYSLEDEDFEVGLPTVSAQFAEERDFPSSGGARRGDASPPYASDQAAIDDAVESIRPEDLQEQMDGVLKPVIDLIAQGDSYEDVLSKLAETFPDMEDTALQEMLSRAIFVSEVWGRLNAKK